ICREQPCHPGGHSKNSELQMNAIRIYLRLSAFTRGFIFTSFRRARCAVEVSSYPHFLGALGVLGGCIFQRLQFPFAAGWLGQSAQEKSPILPLACLRVADRQNYYFAGTTRRPRSSRPSTLATRPHFILQIVRSFNDTLPSSNPDRPPVPRSRLHDWSDYVADPRHAPRRRSSQGSHRERRALQD